MNELIDVNDILRLMERLISFPHRAICKHAVCADLLSLLEEKGWTPPESLVQTVIDAEDDLSIPLIRKLLVTTAPNQ